MSDQLTMDTADERLPPLVGVTSVLGVTVWPGDGLLRWAWGLGRRNVLLTDPAARGPRTTGLDLHRIAEALFAGHGEPSIPTLGVTVRGLAESLVAWHRERRPRALATELPLVHPELRIRGRIDVVLACDRSECDCAGRGVLLGDLKTGSIEDAKSHLQVGGGYPILWEGAQAQLDPALRGRPACGGELIRVYDTGETGHSAPARDRRHGFMLALELYRDMERDGRLPEHAL